MILARQEGFRRLQGFTYGEVQTGSILKLGGKVTGKVVECDLEES